MKFCQLTITSKTKNSIAKLTNAWIKNKSFNTVLHYIKKKNRKKIVTVLKSPHVNKTAQEQFQEKLILNSVFIKSHKINKFLIQLKKTLLTYFPDLKISIGFKTYKNQWIWVTKPFNFLKLNFQNCTYNNNTFFLNKMKKTTTFTKNERFKMILNTRKVLKRLESCGYNIKV
jgi:ribosomal protein S10